MTTQIIVDSIMAIVLLAVGIIALVIAVEMGDD